jgi:hypothetical protein
MKSTETEPTHSKVIREGLINKNSRRQSSLEFTVGVMKIAPSSENFFQNFADFLWWFGMPAFNDNDVH